ncbi:MAG: sugar ABC transporter substrate-binding protein [Anaerolineae bacterium]|nr:sugar ABC transporter substrate-binding protein [Anaerolineae bacterium]
MATCISRRDLMRLGALGVGGAALAACAASPAPQVVKETVIVETVVTATPQVVTGPVTIRFTHVADPGELEIMQASIADFEGRNPDIHVVAELVPEDGMDQKITTMVAGGAAPDAVYVHPSFVPLWAEQQVLIPQDDLADRDSDFGVDDFYPETVGYFVYGGKTYGFPYYSGPSVTYFNADFFEEKGVELPTVSAEGFATDSDKWTWEKLVELAVPLTGGEGPNRTFGYWGTPYSLHWFNVAVWSYGGQLWDEEMKQCKLSEPEAVEAIQFQVDMYTKYNISPRPDQAEGLPGGFNSGKVGMRYGIRGNVPGFKGLEFSIGMAPIPRGPKGRFCRNGPNAAGIVSQSRFVDAAWELCKYMAGPKPGDLGGQKYQFEQQRAIPSRASLFNTPEFQDNLLPWESLEVYQNAAEHVKAMPLPARYSEIQRAWREQWDLMLLGQVSVKDGAAAACAAIDPLLAEA